MKHFGPRLLLWTCVLCLCRGNNQESFLKIIQAVILYSFVSQNIQPYLFNVMSMLVFDVSDSFFSYLDNNFNFQKMLFRSKTQRLWNTIIIDYYTKSEEIIEPNFMEVKTKWEKFITPLTCTLPTKFGKHPSRILNKL